MCTPNSNALSSDLGLGVGSDAGLLDLTHESDDTNLGKVLDEVTPPSPAARNTDYASPLTHQDCITMLLIMADVMHRYGILITKATMSEFGAFAGKLGSRASGYRLHVLAEKLVKIHANIKVVHHADDVQPGFSDEEMNLMLKIVLFAVRDAGYDHYEPARYYEFGKLTKLVGNDVQNSSLTTLADTLVNFHLDCLVPKM